MPPTQSSKQWSWWPMLLALAFALIAFLLIGRAVTPSTDTENVPYSRLLAALDKQAVVKAKLSGTQVSWTERDSETTFVAQRIPESDAQELIDQLHAAGAEFSGTQAGIDWLSLLSWLLPIGLFGILILYMLSRSNAVQREAANFGRSRIHNLETSTVHTTFDDVAGVDEAKVELLEVVDFLKNPGKYQRLGGKIPKGVLLLGPPGTGKTLLAKATAGEAQVPFLSMSGSQFVEMFVGVGAARIRDLFERAKREAPCIVFIDEIDTIGKLRGGATTVGGHEEREQTLNQLLAEMDGFEPTTGVIIMAATNRPDVLDPALARAGRFDRHIVVERPDMVGREAILKVHTRKVKLGPNVNLHAVAGGTAGLVGADLANIVNEAALLAARRNAEQVETRDFEAAIERVLAGLTRSTMMSDKEKRLVATHETGHAIVASCLPGADPVQKVSVVPHGAALGITLQAPVEDRHILSRQELEDRITTLLGGRAAEELLLDSTSTGAQDDLVNATALAQKMVCDFGMSEKVGPIAYERPGTLRWLGEAAGLPRQATSEHMAEIIDQEVKALIERCMARAKQLLEEHREVLQSLSTELRTRETLSGEEVRARLQSASTAAQLATAPVAMPNPQDKPTERPAPAA